MEPELYQPNKRVYTVDEVCGLLNNFKVNLGPIAEIIMTMNITPDDFIKMMRVYMGRPGIVNKELLKIMLKQIKERTDDTTQG